MEGVYVSFQEGSIQRSPVTMLSTDCLCHDGDWDRAWFLPNEACDPKHQGQNKRNNMVDPQERGKQQTILHFCLWIFAQYNQTTNPYEYHNIHNQTTKDCIWQPDTDSYLVHITSRSWGAQLGPTTTLNAEAGTWSHPLSSEAPKQQLMMINSQVNAA